jgi:hypothetical protein
MHVLYKLHFFAQLWQLLFGKVHIALFFQVDTSKWVEMISEGKSLFVIVFPRKIFFQTMLVWVSRENTGV